MLSTKEMPSLSSLFSAFASITASIMFLQSMVYQILPHQVRGYLISILHNLIFKAHTPTLITFVFDKENAFGGINQVYEAAGVYLQTLRSPGNKRLNVSKSLKQKGLIICLETGETVTDSYDGMELQWRFVCSTSEEDSNSPGRGGGGGKRQCYELTFRNEDEGKVCDSYIPFVLDRAKAIREERRVLKMHTYSASSGMNWQSVNLDHPATFETVAMDVKKKTKVMEDLNRFVKRKEFYKKVGRAWKRGYLLYGPPGTGKSSLVAAMANHLKFDIYDLQLANVRRDSELRRLLLATGNRSILVIEDIDCSVDLPDRLHGEVKKYDHQNDKNSINGTSLTLSGLLNFVDGLWSSCGDERIIIFTTNHKERLDPALLRPGRMDMHIHMGYCTYEAFKQLASNYLEISGDRHHLYGEIQGLLEETAVTPAQVAEEMMKDEDAESALEGLVDLLKQKKMKGDECDHAKVDEKKWQIC